MSAIHPIDEPSSGDVEILGFGSPPDGSFQYATLPIQLANEVLFWLTDPINIVQSSAVFRSSMIQDQVTELSIGQSRQMTSISSIKDCQSLWDIMYSIIDITVKQIFHCGGAFKIDGKYMCLLDEYVSLRVDIKDLPPHLIEMLIKVIETNDIICDFELIHMSVKKTDMQIISEFSSKVITFQITDDIRHGLIMTFLRSLLAEFVSFYDSPLSQSKSISSYLASSYKPFEYGIMLLTHISSIISNVMHTMNLPATEIEDLIQDIRATILEEWYETIDSNEDCQRSSPVASPRSQSCQDTLYTPYYPT